MKRNRPLMVKFKTRSGNLYVYDPFTNRVFFFPDPMLQILEWYKGKSKEEIFAKLSSSYSKQLLEDYYNQIQRWIKIDGAFFPRKGEPCELNVSEAGYWESLQSKRLTQLFLIVTENCNMRCKYCAYGGHYKFFRTHSSNVMSFETAKKAIDYFIDHLRNPEQIKYLRKPGEDFISFFGGEPLLEFNLVRKCIEYVKSKTRTGKVRYSFSLGTNGTLLTDEMIDYFIKNKVKISISLDGPGEEHDRNRVFANGKGSFRKVFKNLMRIKEKDPYYYKTNVNILAVFDWKSDLKKIAQFFSENEDILPPVIRWQGVRADNTTYYDQLSVMDKKHFSDIFNECKKDYFKQLTGKKSRSIIRLLFDLEAKRTLDRYHFRGNKVYTATCLPGWKLAVYPDGTFHMCEQINHYSPIGDCTNGIDFKKVKRILSDYYNQVVVRNGCNKCIAQNLCNVCFSTCGQDSKFNAESICKATRKGLADQFAFYYSILEENPQAINKLKMGWPDKPSILEDTL